MANSTFFVQECPTCGRRLHVRVEYLGREVVCQHCRGRFVAFDSISRRHGRCDTADALLRRAEHLLEQSASSDPHTKTVRPR